MKNKIISLMLTAAVVLPILSGCGLADSNPPDEFISTEVSLAEQSTPPEIEPPNEPAPDDSADLTEPDPFSISFINMTDSDMEQIRQMTHLNHLSISGEISDLSALGELINLRDLVLSGIWVGDISPLSGLTNLISLWLDGNQISDISPLSGLIYLESLGLSDNKISDISPLSGLSNLRTLTLSHNQISDVSPLFGLTNLRFLRIHNNPLTEAQIAELHAALPDCDIFWEYDGIIESRRLR